MKNISVIVPVYNVEPYLNRCVDSVLSQTYSDFELLLVDDGSPDSCGEICDEYLLADDRVITFHQPNGGLSAARNTGIDWSFACSNSDWLTFIDSDDWIHEQYLELLLSACMRHNVGISVCDYISTDGEEVNAQISGDSDIVDVSSFWMDKRITATVAGCKLYRKELWQTIRFPVGRIHEDEFTTYKLLFSNQTLGYVKDQLYYYFQRQDSIIHNEWTPKSLAYVEALENQLSFFLSSNNTECVLFNGRLLLRVYVNTIEEINKKKEYSHLKKAVLFRFRKTLKQLRGYAVDNVSFFYRRAYPIFKPKELGEKNVVDRAIKKYHLS